LTDLIKLKKIEEKKTESLNQVIPFYKFCFKQ